VQCFESEDALRHPGPKRTFTKTGERT
jgi:hypothetical protein